MRALRVLYVENDPALRGILSFALGRHPGVEKVIACSSANEAIAVTRNTHFDVALLDLALGDSSLNGLELGTAIKSADSNVGIVIYSQHAFSDFAESLPEQFRWGWSVLQKRSDVDLEFLVEILKSTSLGHNTVDEKIIEARKQSAGNPIEQLTVRQREIMAIAATGVDARVIADELGLAAVTVREHLSRAYQILVPAPRPGTDLRTTAVIRYLRETRKYSQRDE